MPDALTIEVKDIPDIGAWLDRQRQPMLDAGVRALSNAVVRNFRRKNQAGNARGFPRSNFWQSAAESVTSAVQGNDMVATVRKEGVRLRWLGGVVRPKPGRKALAIPARAEVAGKWPSEETGRTLFAIWPKHRSFGLLAERRDGRVRALWWLVPKTTHKADPSVVPPAEELRDAIARAMGRVLRAAQ